MPAVLRPEVRPPPFGTLGTVALGLLLNLGILLAPAALLGGHRPIAQPEVGAFLAGASALCLADLAGIRPRRPVLVVSPARHVLALAWLQGLSVLAVFWAGLVQHRIDPPVRVSPWVKALGFVLMLAGALLRYTSIRTLGPRFVTEIHVGAELVRQGVYDRIRHPSESGLLLAAMGTAPLLSSPAAGLVFVALLVPVVFLRTRMEDAALASSFGDRHERYVREAGRFLPLSRGR
jgi:protein-S-isoprenylcysteine O-methyltransferase Ste14